MEENHLVKINPSDAIAQQMDKKFLDYVIKLKTIHYTFKELFKDDEVKKMMEQIAKPFFLEINRILINYLLLEMAKITDPATSTNKKLENFTVENILESIEWPKSVADELKQLNINVVEFRKYIEKARNKILAHFDKNTFLSETTLGTFPLGEDNKFIKTLEKMTNIIHQACCGERYGEIVVTGTGDVHDFIKSLKYSIAFKRLFHESKGEDLIKLDRYLENVNKSE